MLIKVHGPAKAPKTRWEELKPDTLYIIRKDQSADRLVSRGMVQDGRILVTDFSYAHAVVYSPDAAFVGEALPVLSLGVQL